MSFTDCVEAAVKAGRVTREQAEEIYQRQQSASDQFRLDPQHSADSAARMAMELGLERAKQDVRLQKFQAALQAIRNADNVNKMLAHPDGATQGLRSLLTRDASGRSTWNNIEYQTRSIVGQAHAKMAEGISQVRSRWFGLHRDKALLLAAVRELFAESTGNAEAKAFAKSWAEAAEALRLRFNRAGGSIPRRTDWGMPQTHDQVLVGRATAGEWVDFTMARLDLERMVDPDSGLPYTPDAARSVLLQVYETIRTNGLADMVPGAAGGKKLANRRQEARFLVFKDAGSWLEYQERFGSSNLFGTMMEHLHGMARDIALLEGLGPNPASAFKYLQATAQKIEDKPLARQFNQGIFNLINGTGDANRSPAWAHLMGGIRSWNVASKLGAAALSAVSDLAFIRQTAKWNGMSATRTFMRYLSQLNPANEADRILATRTGITALSWSDAYSNVARFSELASGTAGKLGQFSGAGNMAAEITMRASGLNAMTDAGRRAFALEFAANLAEHFDKTYAQLNDAGPMGRSLAARLSPDQWDLLRTTKTAEAHGSRFFVVDELMGREDLPVSQRQQLAAAVQGYLNLELLHAVPEPDALTRVITTGGGLGRGTLAGEASRSLMQFKSFPIAVLSLHLQRAIAARQALGGYSATAYAASLIASTTLLGFMAMQLKQIAKGKDPRDPADPATWAAAFIQGGGAGIYGDFLFSDVNRFGQGPTKTLLGPTAGLIDDATKLTVGNIQELLEGKDTELAADVVSFGSRYMPGGNLWYSRLVLEREVFDQLALAADPSGTRQRFRKAQQRARDESSGYWWRPGSQAPQRAPEFAP